MKFFYQASAMGFGSGWWWHKYVKPFPRFPIVTKTITMHPRKGWPWAVLFLPYLSKSTWNKVRLHNPGFEWWCDYGIQDLNTILSLHGTDEEIQLMADEINMNMFSYSIGGIELNFSCPNVKNENNKKLPETDYPLYLKLNYKQNPYDYGYDIKERIERIHVNALPTFFGGISGRLAQKKNWSFIYRYLDHGFNVAGCSWTSMNDIKRLEDMGCTHVGIASQMLTNPNLVRQLKES